MGHNNDNKLHTIFITAHDLKARNTISFNIVGGICIKTYFPLKYYNTGTITQTHIK